MLELPECEENGFDGLHCPRYYGGGSCSYCGAPQTRFETAGCTEPNRAACPRLCIDFCNKAEEAAERTRGVPVLDEAQPKLGWCEHCGEGVTDFCRGKLRLCPKGLRVLHRNAGVDLPDGGER